MISINAGDLEESILNAWNKRSCSIGLETDEIKYNDKYLCTNTKPCYYKKIENGLQVCHYLDQSIQDIVKLYRK